MYIQFHYCTHLYCGWYWGIYNTCILAWVLPGIDSCDASWGYSVCTLTFHYQKKTLIGNSYAFKSTGTCPWTSRISRYLVPFNVSVPLILPSLILLSTTSPNLASTLNRASFWYFYWGVLRILYFLSVWKAPMRLEHLFRWFSRSLGTQGSVVFWGPPSRMTCGADHWLTPTQRVQYTPCAVKRDLGVVYNVLDNQSVYMSDKL